MEKNSLFLFRDFDKIIIIIILNVNNECPVYNSHEIKNKEKTNSFGGI